MPDMTSYNTTQFRCPTGPVSISFLFLPLVSSSFDFFKKVFWDFTNFNEYPGNLKEANTGSRNQYFHYYCSDNNYSS